MKKWIGVFLAVLCLASFTEAQETRIYPSRTSLPFLNIPLGGNITFGGGVVLTPSTSALTLAGGQLLIPLGSMSAPSLALVGGTNTGIYAFNTGTLAFTGGGIGAFSVNGYQLNLSSTQALGWTVGAIGTATDLLLYREGAAILQMGDDDAAPIAQTFKGADGSGADKAGGDFISAPGRPTGTGTPGVHYIATSTTGTVSNSTQQALVNRVKTTETGVEVLRDNLQSTKIATLTELTTINAAATTDTTIQIPANAIVLGVSVRVTTVIPTAATFTVIGTTTSTAFQTGATVSTAANTTDAGTKSCPYLNTAAQTIRFTPNAQPSDNTGRVRVTIHYILITPPTS